MFATNVYRFSEYTSGLGADGSRTAKIRNEQTLKEEFVDANNLKKLMVETISGKGGKRKTRKGRKRKTRKGRKLRKSRKTKKSRKSRKFRK